MAVLRFSNEWELGNDPARLLWPCYHLLVSPLRIFGTLLPFGDKRPEIAPSAFVAPGTYIIGAVHLGEESSVWYGAVLRGDTELIRIGARTNIQDGCVLHADPGYPAVVPEGREFPPRSLVAGVPARRFGGVTEEQTRDIARGVRSYIERAAAHHE